MENLYQFLRKQSIQWPVYTVASFLKALIFLYIICIHVHMHLYVVHVHVQHVLPKSGVCIYIYTYFKAHCILDKYCFTLAKIH